MKRKIIAVLMAGALAASLAGCSTGLANEYVSIKQYKGIEVPQVLPEDVTDEEVETEIQLRLQMGVKREDIFLVTKLWPTEYEDGAKAIEDTLKRLDTDYVDLLILHQPVGNYLAGYKAMEEAYKAGKVKALGLSNFPQERIQDVIDHCEIKPQMVQVEAHPYYPQTELKAYLAKYEMVLMTWYPLGHGDKSLVGEEVFTKLAEKYGKTNAQIVLRWHVQAGNVIIPGSKNAEHIKDNFNIFDFALTEEEMAEIGKLDKNTRYYNMSLEDAAKNYLSLQIDFNAQE